MSTWSGTYVKKARAYWARQIANAAGMGTPLMCSFHGTDPACPGAVLPGMEWDVDHLTPRVQGGALFAKANQGPAHSRCNRAAGARITNTKRTQQAKRLWNWK